MFAGNLLALLQNNVKRILAYSSIAHMGYLLVAFLASGQPGRSTAVTFYLVAYFVATLGGLVRRDRPCSPARSETPTQMEDYRGLAWRRPWLAAVFTAMLLSLAGIPLTAGFVGKFYLVAAGGAGVPVGAGHHPGGQQRHRPLLLPADHRRDVLAAAGGRESGPPSAGAVAVGDARPGHGDVAGRLARRLSGAAHPHHSLLYPLIC